MLDLSQGAAGPTCAMNLGDLGATILKVEPPGGEWGRTLGPPFVAGVAAAFLGMNRNKRSAVIDLKKPGGSEVVLRLAEQCDVALESFRPGVADRLGIGYEAMAERNPELIYAAISAFGQQNGPWRDRPGVDGVAQAMGGIMSVTGTADGPPVKVGVPAADMAGAMYASQAILAALFARERTGRGQRIDVSLLDSLLAYQVVPLSMFLAGGQSPQRLGSAAPYAAPNEAFPTRDGSRDGCRLHRQAMARALPCPRQAGAGDRSALRHQRRSGCVDRPGAARGPGAVVSHQNDGRVDPTCSTTPTFSAARCCRTRSWSPRSTWPPGMPS